MAVGLLTVVDFTPGTREIFKVADPYKKEYIASPSRNI
jgi:hypothetical protein